MLCFSSLLSTKQHSKSQPLGGSKDGSQRMLNQECTKVDENTFKVQTSAGEVIASTFWDSEGILTMQFLNRVATMNSEQYVHTI